MSGDPATREYSMTDNSAQRRSKSYRLPVEDTELSSAGRDAVGALRDGIREGRVVTARLESPLDNHCVRQCTNPLSGTGPEPAARGRGHAGIGESEAACPANAVVRTGARVCPAGLRTRRRYRPTAGCVIMLLPRGAGPASWKRPIAALATPAHPASASISACRPSRSLTLIRRRN